MKPSPIRAKIVLSILSLFLATTASYADGAPAAVPNARQYDLKSRINGQTYRIWIATPFKRDPAFAYPVLYVLDGNVGFRIAAEIESKLTHDSEAAPAIIVGIGYPTDDLAEWGRRRSLDQTPFVDRGTLGQPPSTDRPTGGGDAFLRVVNEEVKPFVSARYKVDSSRQSLYGYSSSALLALHELFRDPQAFSAYVLGSPIIFYSGGQVLAEEEPFSKRARTGELRLRILVTSSGDEINLGNGPDHGRFVRDASDLADRLAKLNPANITVSRVVFEGETHNSGLAPSLSRAIRFTLPPK